MTDPVSLENVQAQIDAMSPEQRAELEKLVLEQTEGKLWFPTPGPQLDAINCDADVLLFGGSAGCGKTDLILGLAFEYHQKTLIVRRQYTDLTGLTDRAKEINTTEKGYNGSSPPRLKTINGKVIDFAGVSQPGDEERWQGIPRDLLAIDEVVQFPENQVRYLMGWVRSAKKGQRARTVFASNPPTRSTGDWIIGMFAPWLDPEFPGFSDVDPDAPMTKAKPGELRWVVTMGEGDTSKDLWVSGPDAKIDSGKTNKDGTIRYLKPQSRTFIPGKLDDNPFLKDTGYDAVLDGLPPAMRAAMRDGNFMIAREDDPWQIIPTAWVKAAQNRWRPEPPIGIPQCAIGVDAARSGMKSGDKTILARRHDGWFDTLIEKPSSETPHGTDVAGLVLKHRKDGAIVTIDTGETNGAQAYGHLKENGIEVRRSMGMDQSTAKDLNGTFGFFNKRTELLWRFREALDPGQQGGSSIALPRDPELVADLTAARYDHCKIKGSTGVKAMSKKEVVLILGRSPDKGDAVVMSWANGPKALTHSQEWRADQQVGSMGQSFKRNKFKVNKGPRHSGRR